MREKILFILLDQYADWESAYLSTTIKDMANDKFEIKTVSTSNMIKTIGGFITCIDYSIEDIPKDFAGIVLVGGNSWKTSQAEKVLPLVTLALENNKVVGGICAGSEFLGAHGFLNTYKHTSNGVESIKLWDNNNYTNEASYINEQAVRDRNMITANGTGTLEFTKEYLMALGTIEPEVIDNWYNFHKIGYCNLI